MARAFDVLAVVLRIGGVAMVTTVVLPATRSLQLSENPADVLERFECRFAIQARILTLVLFVLEPLVLNCKLSELSERDLQGTVVLIQRTHGAYCRSASSSSREATDGLSPGCSATDRRRHTKRLVAHAHDRG